MMIMAVGVHNRLHSTRTHTQRIVQRKYNNNPHFGNKASHNRLSALQREWRIQPGTTQIHIYIPIPHITNHRNWFGPANHDRMTIGGDPLHDKMHIARRQHCVYICVHMCVIRYPWRMWVCLPAGLCVCFDELRNNMEMHLRANAFDLIVRLIDCFVPRPNGGKVKHKKIVYIV